MIYVIATELTVGGKRRVEHTRISRVIALHPPHDIR
jgi:hypothetical protein